MSDPEADDTLRQKNFELAELVEELRYQIMDLQEEHNQVQSAQNKKIQELQSDNDTIYINMRTEQQQHSDLGEKLKNEIQKNKKLREQIQLNDKDDSLVEIGNDQEFMEEIRRLESGNKQKDEEIADLRSQLSSSNEHRQKYKELLQEIKQANEEFEEENLQLNENNTQMASHIESLLDKLGRKESEEKEFIIFQGENQSDLYTHLQDRSKQEETVDLGDEHQTVSNLARIRGGNKKYISAQKFELSCIEEGNSKIIDDDRQNKPIQMQQLDQDVYNIKKSKQANQFISNFQVNTNNTQIQFQDTNQQEDDEILLKFKPKKVKVKHTQNTLKKQLKMFKKS